MRHATLSASVRLSNYVCFGKSPCAQRETYATPILALDAHTAWAHRPSRGSLFPLFRGQSQPPRLSVTRCGRGQGCCRTCLHTRYIPGAAVRAYSGPAHQSLDIYTFHTLRVPDFQSRFGFSNAPRRTLKWAKGLSLCWGHFVANTMICLNNGPRPAGTRQRGGVGRHGRGKHHRGGVHFHSAATPGPQQVLPKP